MRVTNKSDVPIVESLGASAVAQPVNVINQNLTNCVIDAIAIGPSAIRSFKLQEPANYLTTWFTGSGSALVLLMNKEVYNDLSDEQRGWIDAAGVEFVDLAEEEKARWEAAYADTLAGITASAAGSRTVGDIIAVMWAISLWAAPSNGRIGNWAD